MSTVSEILATVPSQEQILERAVCVQVNFRILGNSKKISTSLFQIDADKNRIKAFKKLLESPELTALQTFKGQTMQWLRTLCLPFAGMKSTFFAAIPAVQKINDGLTARQVEFNALVDEFLAVYPARVAESDPALRAAHDVRDYLPLDQVRHRFGMWWQYLNFGTPTALQSISSELFEAERAKAADKWTNAIENARYLLRGGLQELLDHMLERLTGAGKNGQPKTFQASTLTNLREFLRNFDLRNITDDVELENLTEQIQTLLSGVSIDELKDDVRVRYRIKTGIEMLKTEMNSLVTTRGSRMITFDDDEEDN